MVILASKSPRRQELLRLIQPDFQVIPSGFDEASVKESDPVQLVKRLAQGKAHQIATQHPNEIVIGCDTIVVSPDHVVFGIPNGKRQAEEMLRQLSGRTHTVISGVCVIKQGVRICFHQTTTVTFYSLSDSDLAWYLATGESFDKAGAYGIQGYGGVFVKEIKGDYYNVVGFPVGRVKKVLQVLQK